MMAYSPVTGCNFVCYTHPYYNRLYRHSALFYQLFSYDVVHDMYFYGLLQVELYAFVDT